MHIPGRTNPADFLTRKRFRDARGPVLSTGYDEADSELELFSASPAAAPAGAFVHVGGAPTAPRFLHADFTSALREALPINPTLGPIVAVAAGAVEADGTPCGSASPPRRLFVCLKSSR